MLSYSPYAVTYIKDFVHRGRTRCVSGKLQLAIRYKLIKHWNSLSDIYIGRVSIAHKNIHSSGPWLQDELQELLCAHPLLEVQTHPSDFKIREWILFIVAELR